MPMLKRFAGEDFRLAGYKLLYGIEQLLFGNALN